MSEIAIRVENLSKMYRIGRAQQRHDTLRDAIAGALKGIRFKRSNAQPANDEHIWALNDVSLEVKRGEVVGIIGRNGAGKTTLLKILSRITEPTRGRVEIRGRVGSLLEVGTGFHPELTGRENIYLNGAILGMKRAEIDRRFDEIVAFAEIVKFLDTPVKRYSSGMYVRLAFAVAAHLEPEILLVDEVLAVGDLAFQRKCLGKMDDVAKEGRTIVFVSHNMPSIRKLCGVAHWLDEGSLRASGVAGEMVNLYQRTALGEVTSRSSGTLSSIAANREHGVEVHGVRAVFDPDNEPPALKVDVWGRTTREIKRLAAGIQLTTLEGVLVSTVGSVIAKSILEDVDGEWAFTFLFDRITDHLAGGEYFVNVRLGRPQMGHILILRNAALARIPATDVFGVGLVFGPDTHGLVPLPVRFVRRK